MAKGNKSKGNRKGGNRSRYVANSAKPMAYSKGGLSITPQLAGDLQQVTAMANPFSAAARGSKVPDSDSSRSIAVTVRDRFTLTSDAGGHVGCEVRPTITNMFRLSATAASTEITTWGSLVSAVDKAAIDGSFSQYRIVSWGIRVIPVNAVMEQKGSMRVITSPAAAAPAPFVTSGGLHEDIQTFPNYGSDVHWISKPKGNAHLDYVDITATCSWDRVIVHIVNQEPSKAVAEVEVIMNIECQVDLNSIVASAATPAADHKPHVLTAANKVHTRRPTVHNGSTQSLGSKLWGFAKNALVDVASSAIPYVGGAVRRLLTSATPRTPALMDRVMEVD